MVYSVSNSFWSLAFNDALGVVSVIFNPFEIKGVPKSLVFLSDSIEFHRYVGIWKESLMYTEMSVCILICDI